MADLLTIKFDLGAVTDLAAKVEGAAADVLKEEGALLAAQAHAHLIELAQAELHSRRKTFLEGVHFEQVSKSTWLIALPPEILWIEDGVPENMHMLDHLLKSPKAKTAKDGSKYVIVPFENNRGKADNTDSGRELRSAIQQALRKRGLPFDKIERHEDGSAKLGLLHQIPIPDTEHPLKTKEGVGQGKGPVGAPKQGRTGIPFLQGLRVYQRPGQDMAGRPRVSRHLMTFRVASSKQNSSTDWVHPGTPPMRFLDRTYEWALKEWEENVRPRVLKKILG